MLEELGSIFSGIAALVYRSRHPSTEGILAISYLMFYIYNQTVIHGVQGFSWEWNKILDGSKLF